MSNGLVLHPNNAELHMDKGYILYIQGRLDEAVAEAERGEIASRPRSCGYGGAGCEFPTICRCER